LPAGIRYSEHLDGDGATIFADACRLGCEGIVSKRRDHPYRSVGAKQGLAQDQELAGAGGAPL
jgi:bifunctional non-homologous end joining protein LigD